MNTDESSEKWSKKVKGCSVKLFYVAFFLVLVVCIGRLYSAHVKARFIAPYKEMVSRNCTISDFKSRFGKPDDIKDWKELIDFYSIYVPREHPSISEAEYFLVYESYPYCAYIYFDANKKAFVAVVGMNG